MSRFSIVLLLLSFHSKLNRIVSALSQEILLIRVKIVTIDRGRDKNENNKMKRQTKTRPSMAYFNADIISTPCQRHHFLEACKSRNLIYSNMKFQAVQSPTGIRSDVFALSGASVQSTFIDDHQMLCFLAVPFC